MSQQDSNIALLVFARSSKEEAKYKHFQNVKKFDISEAISNSLQKQTQQLVNHLTVPVFWISSEQQMGASFGEKLANAFQSVYAKGYTKVIAIGNDCPELTLRDLQNAIHLFENHNSILAPTQDGGAYLIGLAKEVFDFEAFKNLTWCKSSLWAELLEYTIHFTDSICFLGLKQDIDTQYDLIQVIQRLPKNHLFRVEILCLLLLFTSKIFQNQTIRLPFFFFLIFPSLKAPPFI